VSTQGSLRKDSKAGTWYFVVDLPSIGGKRRQAFRRGFATKKAAQEALDKLKAQANNGLLVQPSRLTLAGFLTEHWLPTMTSRVRPTTYDSYRRIVGAHIVPRLGTESLQRLERSTVGRWIAELADSGLAPKTVRNAHAVLTKALSDAVEMELVSRNVASRVGGLPAVEHPAPRTLTAEQLGWFLSAVESDRLEVLWRFLAVTGCRRGEAIGLRWRDVDLETSTVTITNQRTLAAGKVIEGAPKTRAGNRTVTVDADTVRGLRVWRKRQAEDRLTMGAGWPDSDFVFTHGDGRPLWPQTVTARFREVTDELGLPRIGVHGLRHTSATLLIASGVNPRVVQQRLGHAHVSITLGLYTAVLPAHDREAAEVLATAVRDRS
jgi:integrase